MNASDLLQACRDALASTNVHAFLRLIREGESAQTDDAYWWLYGSTRSRAILAESLAEHPRKRTYEEYDGQFIKNGRLDYTTAFGAYQITATTWDTTVQPALHLPDITPASQDLAAAYLLRYRGALADVIAGRVEQAIAKCREEWVSLPGARAGDQPSQHLQRALQVYLLYGGQFQPAPAAPEPAEAPQATTPPPAPDPTPSAAPVEPQAPSQAPTEDDIQAGRAYIQPENTMAPFVAAALPYVLDAAPALIDFFKGDSKVAARNSEAAKVVVAIAKEAVGARNEQDLIETMQSDPSAAPKVKAAVEANWFDIHKAAEQSVSAARDFATNYSQLTNVRLVWGRMTFIELMSAFFAVVGMLGGLYLVRWGNLGDALNGSIITLILIESVVGVRKFWLGNPQPGETRSAAK